MNSALPFLPFLRICLLGWIVAQAYCVSGQETERFYLSGRDKDTAVPWQFRCTSGAQSGYWTNLVVPSHWDIHGFGSLSYKKDTDDAWDERGLYRHDFEVPSGWEGKRVFLVFEGVMTDTDAKLNGKVVGPTHRGGFYRFKYEVTRLVRVGETNTLEVEVARRSANESVNKAERLADYWVFAGIYRPVYLEAVPQQFIERVAIDAKHDGAFEMHAVVRGASASDRIEAQIFTLSGDKVGEPFSVEADGAVAVLRTQVESPRPWTAETPDLYEVELQLKRGGQVLHQYKQRFGFRTFEVREGDGLCVNGNKVILKGVNRHSAWPESGRCLSEAVHRLDIETMKDMNMNAVRMSHYPPDVEFLDLCDELGLYVLNELAGWHNHYDNVVGARLVESMVLRDVNHPSILFWNNGNEGGFNTTLDPLFTRFDLQQRPVLHPWTAFNGINTVHYLAYTNAEVAARGEPMLFHMEEMAEFVDTNLTGGLIYMPTEFMHGLYDGGAGAGLEDYWSMMMSHSNCAGGFIWVFADEGIIRPDTGKMDTAGNKLPDGIVGPYREREGSFHAIKEIWSPIQVERNPDGSLTIENLYDFINAKDCRFVWQAKRVPFPPNSILDTEILAEGTLAIADLPPGSTTTVPFDASEAEPEADFFSLRVEDPTGRVLWSWAWPSARLEALRQFPNVSSKQAHFTKETTDMLELGFEDVRIRISKLTGLLEEAWQGEDHFSLRNGPRPVTGGFTLQSLVTNAVGGDVVVTATYDGALKEVVWRLRSDGWLQCDYTYTATGTNDAIGVMFDYPERLVSSKRWLGDGPYRVWKNRLGGGTLDVWTNDYNNTITGYRDWLYPESKGCFANVYWMQLATEEGQITLVPDAEVFLQILTPRQPPASLQGKTTFVLPDCGVALLNAIPPVGSKFKPPGTLGPQGQPNVAQGEYSGTLGFHFDKAP